MLFYMSFMGHVMLAIVAIISTSITLHNYLFLVVGIIHFSF